MANWNDKFESKFLKKIKLDEINELRFNLEKNKETNEYQLNIRVLKVSDSYTGPTKYGLILKVEDERKMHELEEFFNDCILNSKTIVDGEK